MAARGERRWPRVGPVQASTPGVNSQPALHHRGPSPIRVLLDEKLGAWRCRRPKRRGAELGRPGRAKLVERRRAAAAGEAGAGGGRVRQDAERAHLAELLAGAGEAGRQRSSWVPIYRSGIRGEGGAWEYRSGIGGGPKRRAELGAGRGAGRGGAPLTARLSASRAGPAFANATAKHSRRAHRTEEAR
jgi:hypothetical protein